MRKILFLVIFLLSSGIVLHAKDSGGRFAGITNEVKVFPGGVKESQLFAQLNLGLNFQDHVWTGEESSAIIAFADLSTFLIKDESEVIISNPEGDRSTLEVIAGKLWVNVKKMASGEDIEIKMGESVTGIKGTNITCSTDSKAHEDRIQVLRGTALVEVRATHEQIQLEEGQELVVRSGGRTEQKSFDIGVEEKNWDKELSTLGDAIPTGEIPEQVPKMQDRQGKQFQAVKEQLLLALAGPIIDQNRLSECRKEIERFIGVLMEDEHLLQNFKTRLAKEGEAGARSGRLPPSIVSAALDAGIRSTRTHREESARLLKMSVAGGNPQVETLRTRSAAAWSEINRLRQELRANPSSLSVSWFEHSRDLTIQELKEIADCNGQATRLLEADPGNPLIQGLVWQISSYEKQANQFLRDLNVLRVDTELLRRMQEIEDQISFQGSLLQGEADLYSSVLSNAQPEERLRASLKLLRRFGTAQRLFMQAQRLFSTTLKSGTSGKYSSSEQADFIAMFESVSTQFERLTQDFEEIQARYQELQSRLGTFLE